MANQKDKMNTSCRFDDVLKQFHDDDDEDSFTNMDFDFQHAHLTQGKDVVLQHVKDDNEHKEKIQTVIDEEHLSQKLSQLSATDKQPLQQDMVTLKKRLQMESPTNATKTIQIDNEKLKNEMPNYLSASNGALDKLFNPLLSKNGNTMNIEDVRQVALLCHKMALVEQQKLLWSAYLCSGLGTITFDDQQQQQPTTSATLSIWPEEVKSTMMTKGVTTTTTNETAIDNDACLNFVRKTLRDYKDLFVQYRTQLHEKVDLLPDFTEEMQEAIAEFIEHEGLASAHQQIKMKVATVKYTYKDRMIEEDFHQLNPNQHQLHVFQNLTRAKQEKTMANYDLAILKQRTVHNNLPESINTPQIQPPSSIHTIDDDTSRQHLSNRYVKVIEHTKTDIMSAYIASAEAYLHECQVKFDTEVFRMKEDQDSYRTGRQLSDVMINVIERRFKNLSEHFKDLHDFNMCFFTKPPPVTTTTRQVTSAIGADV